MRDILFLDEVRDKNPGLEVLAEGSRDEERRGMGKRPWGALGSFQKRDLEEQRY